MASENYASSEITVPFSDDKDESVSEDQLIIEEEKLKLTNPAEAEKRKDRRNARAAERERQRKEQEEQLKTERAEKEELKTRLLRLEGYVTAQSQRPAAQSAADEKDEFDKRLEAIEERRSQALLACQAEVAAGTITPERQKHWDRQGIAFEKERMDVHLERAFAKKSVEDAARQQQNEGQQFWKQRHPEVYSNQTAAYWARARAMQRIAEGEADGHDLVESVMQETKVKFKLGKPTSAPTATERARFTGVPSSGGGGGDGKGASGIAMTKELKKMAEAMYSDLPAEKAHQKWVNEIGKPLREKRVL